MIDVKQAVSSAVSFISDVYADAGLSDLRLEEAELSENGDLWQITLSYLIRTDPGELQLALGLQGREYKIVSVDSRTGKFRSMKIRQLA